MSQEHPAPLTLVPGRATKPVPRAAMLNADAGRHWVVGPEADVDGFLRQVAAVCEASGPGGGPPDVVWLREIAKVYGLVPKE
jgi:hypothetical protein